MVLLKKPQNRSYKLLYLNPPEEEPLEEVSPEEKSPKGKIILERNILYQHTENFDEKQIVVDNVFLFKVALDITRSDVDYEPQFVEVCPRQDD